MSRYIDAETIPNLFDEKFKETQKLIEAGETQLDNLAEGFAEAEKKLYCSKYPQPMCGKSSTEK